MDVGGRAKQDARAEDRRFGARSDREAARYRECTAANPSLSAGFMVALPVSPRREIVNSARPGREQRQQWIRVPGSRRVWAAALLLEHEFQVNLSNLIILVRHIMSSSCII